jgi:hypothetical protein
MCVRRAHADVGDSRFDEDELEAMGLVIEDLLIPDRPDPDKHDR